jgi:glycosyltransferase involved in cell wall biosynthesis
MLPKPKIAFLYSEIAGYFLACAEVLAKHAEVVVVRWPVNSEAPFKFKAIDGITIVSKADYTYDALHKMIHDFKPSTLVCSGWMDKDYLNIVKSFDKRVPTVLTLDNHWVGSIKQRIASLLSPFYLRNKFTHAWVPGSPQVKFAKALGFKNISTGFYCADVSLHKQNFKNELVSKTKQFLYVGRYVKHKSIFEMWEAFIALVDSGEAKDWEMVCAGAGEEFQNKIEHPNIKHVGFLQPEELKVLLKANPIYILPSSFEPWGVSVQEFAIAGCPLIISDKVGSSELFLEDEKNGYMVSPTVESIKEGMRAMIKLDENTFNDMRFLSHEKGVSYTPEMWAKKLLSIKI